jgi:hypothetical protein
VTIPRGAYFVAGAIAVLLGAAAIVRGTRGVVTAQDSDLTSFFFRSANEILAGHPWQIYAVRAFGGYPNYNPPLSIFLMAPLLGIAKALGLTANYGAQITFVSIPFIGFVLLLGYATVVALRHLYPAISETQRFLAYILIVFSPLTWQTFTIWYHLEQPMMLALLVGAVVAFQMQREGLGGVLAGLAVLSRTTAIVPLVAFGVLLLVGGEWRALWRFGGAAAGVAAVGFAPFFLLDRANATYSLLTWRGGAEIGGNSIWTWFKYDGPQSASPLRYALDHAARRLDMYTVIVVVVVVAVLAMTHLRISAYGREAWAVLAIAALCVPMLTKNNWPYYYLEPFVFLLIWEFASMHDRRFGLWRWPVLTFTFLSVAATLSQFIGLQSVGVLDRIAVGTIEFGVMAAFAVAIWYRAGAGRIAQALGTAAAARGAQARGGASQGVPGGGPRGRTAQQRQGAADRRGPEGPAGSPAPAPWAAPFGFPAPATGPVRPPEGWRPAGPPFSPPQGPPPDYQQPSTGWPQQDAGAPWPPSKDAPPPRQPVPRDALPDWLREDPDPFGPASAPWGNDTSAPPNQPPPPGRRR